MADLNSREVLDAVIAVIGDPEKVAAAFCTAVDAVRPELGAREVSAGVALYCVHLLDAVIDGSTVTEDAYRTVVDCMIELLQAGRKTPAPEVARA